MSQIETATSSLRRFAMLLAAIAVAFLALGIGVGLTLTASGALATHDGSATVHACVDRVSRVARIVEDPDSCTRYERLVEWQSASGAADLEARISALEAQVPDCLRTAGEGDLNTIAGDAIFEGCNVHVRNGMDGTDTTNERGNLIVGYNERDPNDMRTGSHNLVVGPWHAYSDFGGFVAGMDNTIQGSFASVIGGQGNTASGPWSSVSGGRDNTASGQDSSVSGGRNNTAQGLGSSVSGGNLNTASGDTSSVSGGNHNAASSQFSSVSGGDTNTAEGVASSVAGGVTGTISDDFDSLIGNQIFPDSP